MTFPQPPAVDVLRKTPPAFKRLPKGTLLARVYFSAGRYPSGWNAFRHYGPTNGRFDHHRCDKQGDAQRQDRSIFYCATNGLTCLAEVFQETRRIDRVRDAPWLVVFRLQRTLTLLDLTGTYPTRVGASMAINTGTRIRARAWARQFYAAFDYHGILYASSMHANSPAMALNDRAEKANALPLHPLFNRALADDALLDTLKHAAATLGYGLR